MSAAETGQVSAAGTRQMSSIETGQRPVAIVDICLVSAADICPVSTADICPLSSNDDGFWPAHLSPDAHNKKILGCAPEYFSILVLPVYALDGCARLSLDAGLIFGRGSIGWMRTLGHTQTPVCGLDWGFHMRGYSHTSVHPWLG